MVWRIFIKKYRDALVTMAVFSVLLLILLGVIIFSPESITERSKLTCTKIGGMCRESCDELGSHYISVAPMYGEAGECKEGENCCVNRQKID